MLIFPTTFEILLCLMTGCVTTPKKNLLCSSTQNLDKIEYAPNYKGLTIHGKATVPGILKKDSVQNLPNITIFIAYYGVNDIERGVFTGLDKLTMVYFEQCDLPLIKEYYFENSNLSRLSLHKSNVKDIEAGAFSTLYSIKEAWFTENPLSIIRKGMFENTNFETLHLYKNKIESIEDGSFYGMKNLIYLDLSDNLLTKFNANLTIGHSLVFEHLDLGKNKFKVLSEEPINSLPNIKYFNVGKNMIGKVEWSFYDFKNLETIDVSENIFMTSDKAYEDMKNKLSEATEGNIRVHI